MKEHLTFNYAGLQKYFFDVPLTENIKTLIYTFKTFVIQLQSM